MKEVMRYREALHTGLQLVTQDGFISVVELGEEVLGSHRGRGKIGQPLVLRRPSRKLKG